MYLHCSSLQAFTVPIMLMLSGNAAKSIQYTA